jgi:hypothetical protein
MTTYLNPWKLPLLIATAALALAISKVSTLGTSRSDWHRGPVKESEEVSIRCMVLHNGETKVHQCQHLSNDHHLKSGGQDCRELEGAGCTCWRGRRNGEGMTKGDTMAGDTVVIPYASIIH